MAQVHPTEVEDQEQGQGQDLDQGPFGQVEFVVVDLDSVKLDQLGLL